MSKCSGLTIMLWKKFRDEWCKYRYVFNRKWICMYNCSDGYSDCRMTRCPAKPAVARIRGKEGGAR